MLSETNDNQIIDGRTHPKKSLATLDGEIVDPEITVELEMRDVLKVHGAQTLH